MLTAGAFPSNYVDGLFAALLARSLRTVMVVNSCIVDRVSDDGILILLLFYLLRLPLQSSDGVVSYNRAGYNT